MWRTDDGRCPFDVSTPPRPRRSRTRVALFVISFVILFFELACIRWFGSTVVFLTFFTNIVLLACVLGMSAGCLAASRRFDFVSAMIPLTLLAVILAQGMLWGYRHHRVAIGVGNNQASPQQVYFGTETPGLGSSASIVPIEVIAGVFFALIALMFVGPGQMLGRALGAIPNRLSAYATNIAGSLAGIVAFSLVSYARTPPAVWFALALVPLLGFLRRLVWLQALGIGVVLVAGRARADPRFRGRGTGLLVALLQGGLPAGIGSDRDQQHRPSADAVAGPHGRGLRAPLSLEP